MRRVGVVGLSLVAAVLVGCGLPNDSSPRDIPPNYALDDGSTTSAPAAPSTTGPRVYFVGGNASDPGPLVGVSRDVRASDLGDVLTALLDGPTASEQSGGLRTAIPDSTELIDARLLPDGTARVNLSDGIFSASGPALTDAVAQIVFTAAGAGTGARRVVLLVDGELRPWPRGDSSLETQPLTPLMFPALDPTSEPAYVPFPVGGPDTSIPVTATSAPPPGE
jgi:hypothetical protein